MQITINNPNGEPQTFTVPESLEKHWQQPINHCQTILNQINSGMYDRWFKGRTDMACLDFGANVGLVSAYMAANSKHVISVEPTPMHYSILCDTIAVCLRKNGVCNYATTQTALAENERKVVFMTGHSTENKITTPEGYGNGKIEIDAYPLSWFVQERSIDFCKVDIEGYEIYALSQEEINKVAGKVKVFFVEMHPYDNWGFESMSKELTERFENAGYNVELLDFQTLVATWKLT